MASREEAEISPPPTCGGEAVGIQSTARRRPRTSQESSPGAERAAPGPGTPSLQNGEESVSVLSLCAVTRGPRLPLHSLAHAGSVPPPCSAVLATGEGPWVVTVPGRTRGRLEAR